ncbi:hypothetical protein [Streptomyces sp. NPDC048527]|uniref:hypothetical protein n=1 Tax=Streptomyces sp. NPDC048527 TaxID=3365568 RepID=UPI00371C1D3C
MPRTRPAPLPRELPDVGTVRRRARAGASLAVGLLVLPFSAGVLAEGATTLGLLTCPLAFLLFSALCEESPPARHSATRMTARTLTGVRSVDLNHITSIRLLTTFSYGSTYRTIVVRDGHGVRLGVTSAAGRRALNKALERQTVDSTLRRPRVSRAARACLGTGRPSHLAVHTVLVFLAQVEVICAYLVALLKVGGIG